MNACIVVIKPFSISKFLFKTLTTGARQFVVHDAAEIILSFFFNADSFTPYTTVLSAFLQGAETITFFAPFFRCVSNLIFVYY